jgi:hypothetical protein
VTKIICSLPLADDFAISRTGHESKRQIASKNARLLTMRNFASSPETLEIVAVALFYSRVEKVA